MWNYGGDHVYKREKVGVNMEISGGNEVVHTIFPTCSTPPIVTCSTCVKAFHLYNVPCFPQVKHVFYTLIGVTAGGFTLVFHQLS